jgi:hypothetical protein
MVINSSKFSEINLPNGYLASCLLILAWDWLIISAKKAGHKLARKMKSFSGEDKEWLVVYCKEVLQQQQYDYFIFGHRHLPLDIALQKTTGILTWATGLNTTVMPYSMAITSN